MNFKNYSKEDLKWFNDFEKNFESTLKDLKKFREALEKKPYLPAVTAKKYGLYFQLLEQEILEIKDIYDDYEPVQHVTSEED